MNAALLCGQALPPSPARQLLFEFSLMHLLVVSGAHLYFIDRRLKRLHAFPRLLILCVYAWLTGFEAPVVRALLRRSVGVGIHPWGWSSLQIEAVVSLLILLVDPGFLFSRSFTLSWLGALALRIPAPRTKWHTFDFAWRVWLVLWPLQWSSPITIVWNLLFTPLVADLMFPLALLTPLFPPLTRVTDLLWSALVYALARLPAGQPNVSAWTTGLWAYPLLLHFILLTQEPKWRRASAFS